MFLRHPLALQGPLLVGFSVLWITHHDVVSRPVDAFSTAFCSPSPPPPPRPSSVLIPQRQGRRPSSIRHRLAATIDDDITTTTPTATPLEGNPFVKAAVLAAWNTIVDDEEEDRRYVQQMLGDDDDGDNDDRLRGFYAMGRALKASGMAMGLKGSPFVIRSHELSTGTSTTEEESFGHSFFTMKDVAKAVEDDFLDAAKGSTDNRKGWKVR